MTWNYYDYVWNRWKNKEIEENIVIRALYSAMRTQEQYCAQELEEIEKRAELHKGDN